MLRGEITKDEAKQIEKCGWIGGLCGSVWSEISDRFVLARQNHKVRLPANARRVKGQRDARAPPP